MPPDIMVFDGVPDKDLIIYENLSSGIIVLQWRVSSYFSSVPVQQVRNIFKAGTFLNRIQEAYELLLNKISSQYEINCLIALHYIICEIR